MEEYELKQNSQKYKKYRCSSQSKQRVVSDKLEKIVLAIEENEDKLGNLGIHDDSSARFRLLDLRNLC